ncbi:hypothetical protein CTKA_01401 [Chthonomonas calidirosea]|uniref:DUF4384 domain-containing protein n=1 Tax=Chthonomonas calidirosea (strain DSM 23976 / ICMP 18418 / T49) TaxID=1303518 RepID=S0EX26_CHTCT|nr:hypothetical protein [Chthonomonas calidirosea]CCW36480.1 hypothetical protein CCALI_02690 [Chthonomonas calidirosea T49]CEK17214.1 hypothetical protein CTKA_01401 [Chthonomonas calidirosea]
MLTKRMIYPVCAVLGALTLLNGLQRQASALPQTTEGQVLQGMQNLYLSGPVLRFYANADPDAVPSIPDNLLQLANFSKGANRHIYLNVARVRQVIANDEALAVFLNDPNVGPRLQQALQQALLYAGLEANPNAGFNSYNELNAMFGGKRRARIAANPNRLLKRGGQVRPSSPLATPNPPNSATSVASDTQQTVGNSSAQPKKGANLKNFVADELQKAQAAAINDFTVLVGLSPDGRQATLYVLGSLPQQQNPDVPVSFTVEGRTYREGDADSAGNDQPSNYTLVDKLNLPAASQEARYFCYVYPLVTPDPTTQIDFTVRYWPAPFLSIIHDVALAHSGVSASPNTIYGWTAVPLTRLIRYNPKQALLDYVLDRAALGGDVQQAEQELLYGRARKRLLQNRAAQKRQALRRRPNQNLQGSPTVPQGNSGQN